VRSARSSVWGGGFFYKGTVLYRVAVRPFGEHSFRNGASGFYENFHSFSMGDPPLSGGNLNVSYREFMMGSFFSPPDRRLVVALGRLGSIFSCLCLSLGTIDVS